MSCEVVNGNKRVRVCVRLRPVVQGQGREEDRRGDQNVVQVSHDRGEATIQVAQSDGKGVVYRFDQVLNDESTQEQVFQRVAQGIATSVIEGYNGTILAYGQTGAGKTYTMTGKSDNFSNRGICPRTISFIMRTLQTDSRRFQVCISYIEIYNEQLYDLLSFNDDVKACRYMSIQENKQGETFVKGLTKPLIQNEDEALDYLFQGETNRRIAEHSLNDASTRSHCIFTLYLERRSADDNADGEIVSSKLNLVDLAGSERTKKTQTSGNTFKEATHINKSLTFLEQVVLALGEKGRDHIPYRQTKLTNILKDSLGGNCRTQLVACVWPHESHIDQTLATLKFATRMMRIKTSAVVNVLPDHSKQATKYLKEIQLLKQELAMHDVLCGRKEQLSYGNLTVEDKHMLQAQVAKYLQDDTEKINFGNLTEAYELFSIFRGMIKQQEEISVSPLNSQKIETQMESNNTNIMPELVNDREAEETLASSKQISKHWNSSMQESLEVASAVEPCEEMFRKFCEQHSIQENKQYEDAKLKLRIIKKQVKEVTSQVNICKSEIDAQLKASNEGSDANSLTALKEAKKKYRAAFEQLNELNSEMKYTQRVKESCFQVLVEGFKSW